MPDERWLIRNPANGRTMIARRIPWPYDEATWAAEQALMRRGHAWEMVYADAFRLFEQPVIFREFERWKRPWWARAIAWAIALYYVRGSRRA